MILEWTSTKVVQIIMISQKTWLPGAGPVFHIWLYRKFWKSSSPKHLVGFPNNFTGMILGWTSTKDVQRIMVSQKTWPPGAGPVFHVWLYRKLWKSSSPKRLVWFQKKFIGMILGWTSTKVVQRIMLSQKTWPPRAGQFSIYGYIGNFENLLLQNY